MVNQHEVSREEFRWFMEQERAGVVAYFKARHNLEDGPGFWNHEAGGTTPKAALQQRTVERLVREKVEQSLFQDLGLVRDISYTAFLQQFEKSNQARATLLDPGKPSTPSPSTGISVLGSGKLTPSPLAFRPFEAELLKQNAGPDVAAVVAVQVAMPVLMAWAWT